MTINKVIETLGRLKPSAVQDQDIAAWLLQLDGQLFYELQMPENTVRPRTWPEDGDVALCAPAPYDGFYLHYAQAMVEFARREYGEYNNSISLFNEAVWSFRRAWRREHPAKCGTFQGVWP